MPDMIVSCAGCGKRCRGASGSRKFKCAHCSNLLTFPDSPREAQAGSVLCSFCWSSIPVSDSLSACPSCSQKVFANFSGKCVVFAEASSSSQRMAGIPASESQQQMPKVIASDSQPRMQRIETPVADPRVPELQQQLEAAAKTKHELEQKVAELVRMLTQAQTDQAMHRMDLDRAQRQVKEAQGEIANLHKEMDHFRDSTVQALVPLGEEYDKLMKKLIGRCEDLEQDISRFQEEMMSRALELRHVAERLRENIDLTRRDYLQRLAIILGAEAESTPVEQPASNPNLQAVLGEPGSA